MISGAAAAAAQKSLESGGRVAVAGGFGQGTGKIMHAVAATPPDDLPRLPARPDEASKRDFGRVLVVGGSLGMAGAPALAAMAAIRSGAGLAELLVPEAVAAIAAGFDPCVMTRGLPASFAGTFAGAAAEEILESLERATALAIGPGLGRSAEVAGLVARLWKETRVPAVFDADALWALAQLAPDALADHAGPRVVTPHAGEMLRLAGREPGGPDAADRGLLAGLAREFATTAAAVVVLKGAGTLICPAEPAATREAVNETGNSGMATGGTGDVLTGVVAALLAQGLEPFAAARLGAWVHGLAGDAAATELGQISMTARDLLDRLHVGFRAANLLA
jgi:ADP-dependent NAD(P)H-hydrate dehydratase